jgi:hypothetical protein
MLSLRNQHFVSIATAKAASDYITQANYNILFAETQGVFRFLIAKIQAAKSIFFCGCLFSRLFAHISGETGALFLHLSHTPGHRRPVAVHKMLILFILPAPAAPAQPAPTTETPKPEAPATEAKPAEEKQ